MRGRKQSTELLDLSDGLEAIEDPYHIKDLLQFSLERLAEEVKQEIRYSALSMMRAGRYFHAIKAKLEHGDWEEFVQKHHWSWDYVRCSMKMLEVATRFPHAIHLPIEGRLADRFLRLPMNQLHEVLSDFPEEAVKKLTPWDLQTIYEKKRLENIKAKRKKHLKSYDGVEPETSELDDLVVKALSALRLIADYPISDKEAKRARSRYLNQIEVAWNRAAYNLKDPKHESKPWWESHPAEDWDNEATAEEHSSQRRS